MFRTVKTIYNTLLYVALVAMATIIYAEYIGRIDFQAAGASVQVDYLAQLEADQKKKTITRR